ncbi:hypothetical protein ACYOEI_03940 [Singulisphaera rosea]
MASKRPSWRKAKAALAWGLIWLVVGQFGVRLAMHLRPEIADREFGRKLSDLRRKIADNPARPLVLMLGSSRTATGFRPDVLPELTGPDGQTPLVFNFAQVGSGPEMAHLTLQRLLDAGVRPDRLLVEYWPPIWGSERTIKEYVDEINLGCLDWKGVQLLATYTNRPRQLRRLWLATQWFPLYSNRAALLTQLAPSWLLPRAPADHRSQNLDSLGWWSPRHSVPPDEYRKLVEHYRRHYEPQLKDYHASRAADRALRGILALCRREGIQPTVVLLPEGEVFRNLYAPATLDLVRDYLDELGRECHAHVVDARSWVGDVGFMDGHHLLPSGASTFTRRLGTEVLGPMIARGDGPVTR